MKLVRIEDLPVRERVNHAREGKFIYYQLLEGDEGDINNYSLQLVHLFSDFFSPRHRHNFDQIRFQVGGAYDFDRNGTLREGGVAYFPEGAYYGPQKSITPETKLLVLQFGGAAGQGYMSEATYDRAVAELKREGEFQRGVFTRVDGEGRKKNKDAYEAVWEHVNGRPLAYPPARYQAPVFIEPWHHRWTPVGQAGGVRRRALGTFTDRGIEVATYALDAGAAWTFSGSAIVFVVKGCGRAAEAPWSAHSAIRLEDGESVVLRADADSEVLFLGLPPVSTAAAEGMPERDAEAAQAARSA